MSPAQDSQAHGNELLQHAFQFSDIRAEKAPAFQLKATFSFVGRDLETAQGTYTETWVSDSQWRRETVIGILQKIEVGKLDKRWLFESDAFPAPAENLAGVMKIVPSVTNGDLTFASVTERQVGDMTVECAETAFKIAKVPFVFCFEKKSGLLLERLSPERRTLNVVAFSCRHGAYRKFGDHWYPHQIRCSEDRHKGISIDVVDLSFESAPDQTLFEPPKDAIEMGQCSGKMILPVVPANTDWPKGLRLYTKIVKVWLVVDAEGRAQHVTVLSPARKDSNEDVVNWVQHWSFSPGQCDGKPMAMPLTLDVPSTHP